MDNHVFICECNSAEHQFVITYDGDYFYLTPYLSPYLKLFKRFFLGIKYIFGHKSKYGAFDSVILSKKRATKLGNILLNKNNAIIDYEI